MKQLLPALLLLLSIYIYSCANQGFPSGGPKDTIPPLLINSIPTTGQTNYNDNTITLEFDERINIDKLKRELTISPRTEIKFKTKQKKNSITLELEESLNDSTTYTFNFAEGITDITEKNPAENLNISFATGPTIDSAFVFGKVINPINKKALAKILIGLYSINDTTTIFDSQPKYFTKTNEEGTFSLKNIKSGKYNIYAIDDANKNLKLEIATEAIAHIEDTLILNTSQEDTLVLNIQKLDNSKLKFIRAKQTGKYFDLLYTKSISNYKIITHTDSIKIPSSLTKENKTLRFYPSDIVNHKTDSLQLIVESTDTIRHSTIDTVYLSFSETKRKNEELITLVSPKSKSSIQTAFHQTIRLNKPIKNINPSLISINFDTIYTQYIDTTQIQLTNHNNHIIINHSINRDSINALYDSLYQYVMDTTRTDSLHQQEQQLYFSNIKPETINISIPKGTLITHDNDSSEAMSLYYRYINPENRGTISGKVLNRTDNIILQLINQNHQTIDQLINPTEYIFHNIQPGSYSFRIIIDKDNDQKWTPANIHYRSELEPSIILDEYIQLRPNWHIENINIDLSDYVKNM